MTMTLVLAAGVPAALGTACWARRRSHQPALSDSRGIALQTVIIIVVMLVIAGGVAGVLLSRGQDVIGDLEGQDVTRSVDTAAECQAAAESLTGNTSTATFTPGTSCVVTSRATAAGAGGTSTRGSDDATNDRFSVAACQLAGGVHSGQVPTASSAGASVCTISI